MNWKAGLFETRKPWVTIAWNVSLLAIGSFVCSVAIKGILIPQQYLSGGITGLALLLHYVVPALPVVAVYFVLNIPLYVIGWIFVSRRFFFYSLAGLVIFSVLVSLPYPIIPISDPILSALAAGIISGVGSGIILKSLGSAGGLDILSVMLFQRYSIRLGTTVLVFNAVLMLIAALRFPLDKVLYTLVYMYVASHFLNLVVTGLSQRKAVMVISSRWQEISRQIIETLQSGVTVVEGEGGYSGQRQHILYSVISFHELSRFKELVRKVDPDAFVVVTDTLEVMHPRIGNQPHW
jgi:uncharacterized membrane-anchored protein YitT (DUF2179 family)